MSEPHRSRDIDLFSVKNRKARYKAKKSPKHERKRIGKITAALRNTTGRKNNLAMKSLPFIRMLPTCVRDVT